MKKTATKRRPDNADRRNRKAAASGTISLAATEKMLGLTVAVARERYSRLTDREQQVATLMAAGKRNSKIAEELGISPKTLDIHRAKTKEKLEAQTTASVANLVNLVRVAQISVAD